MTALLLFLSTAGAAADWAGRAPFSIPAAELVEAPDDGKSDAPAVVLLEEVHIELDANAQVAIETHRIVRLRTRDALDDWGTVGVTYAAWFEDPAAIDARVVAPDGGEARLDRAHVIDTVSSRYDPSVFSDLRVVSGPLPALVPGSIVEVQLVSHDHRPFFDRGGVYRWMIGDRVRVEHTRITIDADRPFTWKMHGYAGQPVVRKEGRRTTYDFGTSEPIDSMEPMLPPDVAGVPIFEISTAKSWADVAAGYAASVETRLDGADVSAIVDRAGARGRDAGDAQRRLLAEVQKIRYIGIELGDGAIVPTPPAETVARGYGDCKDKATLLVALLRAVGQDANVAVLRTGPGFDVDAASPGLNLFNHAIVAVRSRAGVLTWIDPTSDFATVGDLPAGDQGRLALVASRNTRALVSTSVLPAASNAYHALLTLTPAPHGYGNVSDRIEATGWIGQQYRAGYVGVANEEMQKFVDQTMKRDWLADGPHTWELHDPRDVGAPFTYVMGTSGTKRVETADIDALATIELGRVTGWMPDLVFPLAAGAAPEEPRKHDIVFFPYVADVEARLAVPDGFEPDALPADDRAAHGDIACVLEFANEQTALVARFHFDSGSGRIARGDLDAVRDVMDRCSKMSSVKLHVRHSGYARMAAGKTGEGLAVYRSLVERHPDDALARAQWAAALSRAGYPQAARTDIETALAAAPNDAVIARMSGEVARCDKDGTAYGSGYDRAGTIAGLTRATKLEPDDEYTWDALAFAHDHGTDGKLYGPESDVSAAIDIRLAQHARQAGDTAALVGDLLHVGRYPEAQTVAAAEPGTPAVDALRLAAVALQDGAAAAVRERARLPGTDESRRAALELGAQELIKARRYPDAAAMIDAAAAGSQNPPAVRARAQLIASAKPLDLTNTSKDDPKLLYARFVASSVGLVKDPDDVFSRAVLEALEAEGGTEAIWTTTRASYDASDFPVDVLLDLGIPAMTFQVEGDRDGGTRVTIADRGGMGVNLVLFAVYERRGYRIRAFGTTASEFGREALTRLDRNDLDGARRWLGWAWDAFRTATGSDPFTGAAFSQLWTAAGASPDVTHMRVAAGSLLVGSPFNDRAIEILSAAPSLGPTADAARDRALMFAYREKKDWSATERVAGGLASKYPAADEPWIQRVYALGRAGRTPEAFAAVKERFDRNADDVVALRAEADTASMAGDLSRARAALERLASTDRATAGDLNNLAWYCLFDPAYMQAGLQYATRANQMGQYKQVGHLHTLATLLAEVGRADEAHEVLLQASAISRKDVQESLIWDYVRGRIAEVWGLVEPARAAYRAVAAVHDSESADATWRLADARLKQLGG